MYNKPDMKDAQDRLAHLLSEIHNERAPIGWQNYRGLAASLLNKFPIFDVVNDERFFDPDYQPGCANETSNQ